VPVLASRSDLLRVPAVSVPSPSLFTAFLELRQFLIPRVVSPTLGKDLPHHAATPVARSLSEKPGFFVDTGFLQGYPDRL
jgi:hypothetical protein